METTTQLLSHEELLRALFTEEKRPSVRWLQRMMKARAVPYIKIGRFVYFDLAAVRSALDRKFSIKSKFDR